MLIFNFGCNPQQTSENVEEKSFSEMSTEEKLEDAKKVIIPTDKSIENFEWISNLYRNKKYKFRLEFPKEWEYDNGTAETTLARSLNKEKASVVVVGVTEFKNGLSNIQETDIKEYKKTFNELLLLQNQFAKDFKIQNGSLHNLPAYILQFVTTESAGTKSVEYFIKQVHCYHASKLYVIGINLPLDEWTPSMSVIFDRVVESFIFELT